MRNLVKSLRVMREIREKKGYRRYGKLVFYRALRKVYCYKRRDPVFELSGCWLEKCRFPMLTCDKCHMEY